ILSSTLSGEPSIRIGELPLHEQEAPSARARSALPKLGVGNRAARPQSMVEPTRTVTMQAMRQTWAVLAVLMLGAPTGAFGQANCRHAAPFEPWLADFQKETAAQGTSPATPARASPSPVRRPCHPTST